MEENRSFWGHIITCCLRTGYSALMMHIVNIYGTLYFYGMEDEFEAGIYNGWNESGLWSGMLWLLLFKKFILFVVKMFVWEVFFDCGHYWGHRMAHAIKVLYDFGHCVHHESISLDAWDGMDFFRFLSVCFLFLNMYCFLVCLCVNFILFCF